MLDLKNKTILILSPQSWGKMFLSKHHYAVELAKRGNTVLFLNPPDQTRTSFKRPVVNPSSMQPNLFLIDHILFFPYALKFKAILAFHWFMRFHIHRILREIDRPIDIVWSFDLGYLYPLRYFGNKPLKIFHPVDEPLNRAAIDSAKGSQVIFSVTREILKKYEKYDVPCHFINHGVTEDFIASEGEEYKVGDPIRIGFSGNLLRPDIDRSTLLQITKGNPGCQFEFWGSYQFKDSNIGGADDEGAREFVKTLQNYGNVILHGVVSTEVLATSLQRMDAFLICYDVLKDQSRGTNYHKVMEYLASGSVIISNNITTYRDSPDLIVMTPYRDNNRALPALFTEVIGKLLSYNSDELRARRVAYARDNTYGSQLMRIEALINE